MSDLGELLESIYEIQYNLLQCKHEDERVKLLDQHITHQHVLTHIYGITDVTSQMEDFRNAYIAEYCPEHEERYS